MPRPVLLPAIVLWSPGNLLSLWRVPFGGDIDWRRPVNSRGCDWLCLVNWCIAIVADIQVHDLDTGNSADPRHLFVQLAANLHGYACAMPYASESFGPFCTAYATT